MPDLTPNEQLLSILSDRIEQYKYDPTDLVNVLLDYLEQALDGQVDIVDPTNPFVFLLESAAMTASSNITTGLDFLRKQFPSLAKDRYDLYHHMSWLDYVGIFANPGRCKFTVLYRLDELVNRAVDVPGSGFSRLILPRTSKIIVDKHLVFTTHYPIWIDIWTENTIQVRYDISRPVPFRQVKDFIIPHYYITDSEKKKWLVFDLIVDQLMIDSSQYPVLTSTSFQQTKPYTDKLYLVRVYQKNSSTGGRWEEMAVTYSDMVFDPAKPTAQIVDLGDRIDITIPIVYFTSGLVSGEIRVDVYTTKGNYYYNLSDLKPEYFQLDYNPIDPLDTDTYSAPISQVPTIIYSQDILYNGTDPVDFTTLRERVVHHTTGPNETPITEESLKVYVNNRGFSLYKAYDVLTQRIYIAHRWLPLPKTIGDETLLSSIELSRETLSSTIDALDGKQSILSTQINRIVIPHDTVFYIDNGRLVPVADNLLLDISMQPETYLNRNQYYNNLFHTIVDVFDQSINTRSYDLLHPTAENVVVLDINETIEPKADIDGITIEKYPDRYVITVRLAGNQPFNSLPDANVGVCLKLQASETGSTVLVDGVYDSTVEGKRQYLFTLKTDNDIDQYHNIALLDIAGIKRLFVQLTNQAVFYTYITDPSYPIGSFSVNAELAGLKKPQLQVLTKEQITLVFGYYLKHIWMRPRLSYTENKYRTYDTDIYAYYEEDVFRVDPKTGTPFIVDQNCNITTEIIHRKGDPILNPDGSRVIKHRRGDIVKDDNGNPIIDLRSGVEFSIDLPLYPTEYYYATHESYVRHRKDTYRLVRQWILDDIEQLNDKTLELTEIRYMPISKSGPIDIDIGNDRIATVDSSYSPNIVLYVTETTANNIEELATIKQTIGQYLIEYLYNRKLSVTELKRFITEKFENTLLGIDIKAFYPLENYEVFSIVKEDERMTIHRKLVQTPDKKRIVVYDIDFTTVVIQ